MEQDEKLPRRGLREENFRKYELLIAQAVRNKQVKVERQTLLEMHLRPTSFISQFDEARRGFRIYRYTSEWIPEGADVSVIRASELRDGGVLLENVLGKPVGVEKPFMTAKQLARCRSKALARK